MKAVTKEITLDTSGDPDLVDITSRISEALKSSGLKDGLLTVFVVGSTAAITTFEFEPGMVEDIRQLYDKIVPRRRDYAHDRTWGDANGFSHLRAALQGPALSIPFKNASLTLGTWQQVVLAEFDNRPRRRRLIVQIIGQ